MQEQSWFAWGDLMSYPEDMSKNAHVSARVFTDKKTDYERTAAALGYQDLSGLMVDLLDVISSNTELDPWECRLLHMEDGRIVGSGPVTGTGLSPLISAFPIVAPEHFWRRVDQISEKRGR